MISRPQTCEASRISTWSSLIHRYTGALAAPVTTIASQPARLSSAPQKPPTSASPKPPVSGDFAPTACRDAPESGVPVSTPMAKMRMFSGPSGSAPFGSSVSR